VVAALLLARYVSLTVMPQLTSSMYGPYLFAPMGWLAAGGVGLYFYRQLPQPAGTETTIDRRTVLLVGGLIGCFLVSLQFMTGMVAGFGHSPYAHTPRWLAINLLFAGSILVATEFSRAALLRAIGPRSLTLALVLTTLGLAAVQFTDSQLLQTGLTHGAEFWGSRFIPLAATGLLAGFFVLYGGIFAGLLVSAPLVVFQFYSPVLPSADWPILALAGVAGPAMGLWIAEGLFTADEAPEESTGWFHLPSVSWVMTAIIGLAIFWFSFGFFGFRPAFVPSHSMEPLINQGDVVLVGPVHADTVKVGDIVLYEMSNKQRVLHRVVKIDTTAEGGREFYFKGDNNNAEDLLPVTDKQLIGSYIQRVPKIGWVAIKFNQLIGGMH
jgi:signal peptidase